MPISFLSCILVNHQPRMGKNLKAATRKSSPVTVRTWKQMKKKSSQLCSTASHLFCVVCCLLANWEPQPNRLAAKHRDLYRFGHVTFWCHFIWWGSTEWTWGFLNSKTTFLPLQVNGKTYNQARLLLGTMGSLHPANRLAAYITGRVILPPEITKRTSLKLDAANKANPPAILLLNAAGTAAPSTTTATTTTTTTTMELKTPAQLPGKCGVRDTSTVLKGFLLSGNRSISLGNLPALTPAATADHWKRQMKWSPLNVRL